MNYKVVYCLCKMSEQPKKEFWEAAFTDKREMWGCEPAQSAVIAKELFAEQGVKNVLVPGIGYGRNAQLFIDNGMSVTGVEISATAIEMARNHYGDSMKIYYGSVGDMPYDSKKYDGIFCYALIHLLGSEERKKLIQDCYNQLTDNGYMVFTAISKDAATYGTGTFISEDRYELHGGVKMFFYDKEVITEEFSNAGLYEVTMIEESYPFFLVKCKKA